MKVTIIPYGSKAYEQMIQLRLEVLRKPLGLNFSEDDLQKESKDVFVGAFEKDKLVGCCVLTERSLDTIQLRQMAVAPELQGNGIGSTLLLFAEQWCRKRGYTILMLHAREVAAGFYKKNDYAIV